MWEKYIKESRVEEEIRALVLVVAGEIIHVLSQRPSHLNSKRVDFQCLQKLMISMLPRTRMNDYEMFQQIVRIWHVILVVFRGVWLLDHRLWHKFNQGACHG